MLIDCPYCGRRDSREFTVVGDAKLMRRPDARADDAAERFVSWLHERANVAGLHRELWFHAMGCHSWLVVTRDTLSHRIDTVEVAREMPCEQTSAATGPAR